MPADMTIVVENELGLHARPAAAFVRMAARFPASVHIFNLTSRKGPASARSLLAILGLGVRQGHEVKIVAEGEQEKEAVMALAGLLASPNPLSEETPGQPQEAQP